MRVVVARHPSSLLHDTGRSHPERPARVEAVARGIDDSGLDIEYLESPEIARPELALVHEPSYIEMIERFCELGGGALDVDTIVSAASWQAALTAAGGMKAAIETLRESEDSLGFVLTRPPGHHALPDRAMGFCIFNNVAMAAVLLRAQGERVVILDWDVHHGNGTQTIVRDDPGIVYLSLHQRPFYPFKGEVSDIEVGEAKGTTVNIPLPAGTAGDVYRDAWSRIVIPIVSEFHPDWVLISSGYDGHVLDPLAELQLVDSDYGWISAELAKVHPPNRTVIALEGGYDLDALRLSAKATVLGFSGVVGNDPPLSSHPVSAAAIESAIEVIGQHWSLG